MQTQVNLSQQENDQIHVYLGGTAGSTDFGYFEWFIIGNIAIIEKAKSTCHTAFAQGTNLP